MVFGLSSGTTTVQLEYGNDGNTNAGWSLIGNPHFNDIEVGSLFDGSNDVQASACIWDPDLSSANSSGNDGHQVSNSSLRRCASIFSRQSVRRTATAAALAVGTAEEPWCDW